MFEDGRRNLKSPLPMVKRCDKKELVLVRNPVSTELSPSPSINFNNVNYNNWKRLSISPIDIDNCNFTKASSVNHINIDYGSDNLLFLGE